MRIKTRNLFPAAIMIVAIFSAMDPSTIMADDNPWQLRVAAVSMDLGDGTVSVPGTDEEYSYSASNGLGFAIDLEYRASRRLGIDFGVISASPGIEVTVDDPPLSVEANADLRITPIYAALNVHLTPDSRFDLYVGPVLAYVVYESFDLVAGPELSEPFSVENDFAVGAVIGLDIGLGSAGWSLNTAVRYLETSLEARPADGSVGTTEIDPTIFSLGFGYRF